MKKIFLLLSIFSILLITGCGKKEFDYKLITTPETKEAVVSILLEGSKSKEGNMDTIKILRRIKDARSYNEAAARDYLEWQEEFTNQTGYYFSLDDFLDNYDGDPKNLSKFVR
ncbi:MULTISPECIES: hypothetical protein [unclassified Fusobacterium]|uniref:hypothetical protein n=1 Tax=unclassified Fusobacterium TaxID=2648384 RepID=UPI001B8C766B|nr:MULTISPECIES: hypothetical protein [unclassified Fusobacterium]MBR8700483.1 hypothetical protein [Fusobacterium sp. DD45]MBR8710252.1 hypothetical protein [Fusobacterium sp. DD28]MBR8750774.1 hypothetical protein [Fusobacterium sp. DD26]